MIKKIVYFVTTVILMFSVSGAAGADCDFECGHEVKNYDNLKLAYINATFNTEWYELKSYSERIGEITAKKVNFIFWNKKYMGRVIPLFGSDQINYALRHFKKIYGDSHKNIQEKYYLWMTADEIINVRRFSLQLGQIEIYCRQYFEEWKASREPKTELKEQ